MREEGVKGGFRCFFVQCLVRQQCSGVSNDRYGGQILPWGVSIKHKNKS